MNKREFMAAGMATVAAAPSLAASPTPASRLRFRGPIRLAPKPRACCCTPRPASAWRSTSNPAGTACPRTSTC
jgi:hypothetical protein